jgi:CheY-like chemotaxis protein
MTTRKRFGEILVEAGVLKEDSLQKALEKQKGTKERLGRILEGMGLISEKDSAGVLARQFGFKSVFNLVKYSFPEEVLKLVDSEKALEKGVFPLKVEGSTLYLAMVNPLDMENLDDLSFQTGLRIVPCVTTSGEIQEGVNKHYLRAEKVEKPDWWNILVVDDQEMVRSLVLAALKREGYNTIQATNGAEGLKTAYQHSPHLIISDTIMPRMDGYAMFRALQANNSTRKTPVIALSSRSTAEEEAKLLDMGYFDFVPKPINPVRLVARVKRSLKVVYGETPPAR